MATFPRVGVINLDFKDVSKMAKDIEANDPLKNAIATAGKVLSDRERDILYRRALAEAQGKEVPDETTLIEAFGKGADKVAEGASWLKDKWDRLDIRSPFEETLTPGTVTESPITETPSEKGSREMIGYKPNQSPIETDKYRTNLKAPDRTDVQPNDELSFGFSQDVGQAEEQPSPIVPFATGEQVPEQTGVRVDFGTSEPGLKLRSPFAMRPKEESQEVVSPIEGEEGAAQKLKAPVDQKTQMEAWSEMNRLDPNRAAFDWNRVKSEQDKAAAQKDKTQGLLKEVAAEFANLDPNDQNSWYEARNRWLDVDPNLANFLPANASQDAWDRVQTQGGLAKNVAPKGEFAQRKYIEDQVKQSTFLSQTARAAAKYTEADFYAKKALDLQAQLDKMPTGDKTPEQWMAEYEPQIKELEKATTKNNTASTVKLFGELSGKIGSGAVLDQVKAMISTRLKDISEGKHTEFQDTDDTLKTQADTYSDLAKVLGENKAKIRSAINLISKKVAGGAARIAAKTLQGDVLAESEFSSYKDANPIKQALSNWANKFAGVSFITIKDAQNLVDALVEAYNSQAKDYIDALGTNKYRDKTVAYLTPYSIGGGEGSDNLKKPNANDYPDFNSYNKAMKEYRSKGGK